jgi:hypothetical protein
VIHRFAAFLVLLLLPAFNLACTGYGAPSEVVNGIATVTVEATPSPNFSQYGTFTVTNTIQVQDNRTGTPSNYTRDASQIIPKIQTNMQNRGYTYVAFSPGVRADLVIGLYAYLGTQAYGGYYCNYPYWGYPYACYPTWGYVGSYSFGTLVMQMADIANAPPPTTGAEVGLVWGASIYGVLATENYNLNAVLNGIDQAFTQSPYIKR